MFSRTALALLLTTSALATKVTQVADNLAMNINDKNASDVLGLPGAQNDKSLCGDVYIQPQGMDASDPKVGDLFRVTVAETQTIQVVSGNGQTNTVVRNLPAVDLGYTDGAYHFMGQGTDKGSIVLSKLFIGMQSPEGKQLFQAEDVTYTRVCGSSP